MLRERDWENLLWNVRRGRSVLFLGPEPGGSCEAATAGLHASLAGLLFPLCVTICHAFPPERPRVGRSHFRGLHSPPNVSRSLRTPIIAPPGPAEPVLGPVVAGKTYDLVLWLVQKVAKFPKSYRLSAGQRLIDTGLDLLLLLVDAAYRKDKREPLRTAGLRTNALRFLSSSGRPTTCGWSRNRPYETNVLELRAI